MDSQTQRLKSNGNIYDDIDFTNSIPFKQAMAYHKDLKLSQSQRAEKTSME